MKSNAPLQAQIHWQQVYSLIALDVAIILSWIAYHKYQPDLVNQFGFTEYALLLAVVQGVILVVTPPIAGNIADRIRQSSGNRLPVINVGINFVSMVFMTVAVTVFANPGGPIRWIFPVLIVLWLISMNIFHSPAISMVEIFVPVDKLPSVMAVFIMITEIAYAVEPSINDLIAFFGAPITFAAGGAFVFVTGWMLQRSSLTLTQKAEGSASIQTEDDSSAFGLILGIGLMMGIATTVFFNVFPDYFQEKFRFLEAEGFKGSYYVSLLAVFAAVISVPVGRWIERYGLYKAARLGGISTILGIAGIFLIPQPGLVFCLSLLFPISYALLTVSALPLVFRNLSSRQTVLGVGLFFSGVELPNSLMDIYQVIQG